MMSAGKVIHYREAAAVLLGDSNSGAAKRVLVDGCHDGAAATELVMIELEPGGSSPHHSHDYEVSSFVVEGLGRVLIEDAWHDLRPGDVAHVPANVLHEFVNTGDSALIFLCAIPAVR